MNLNENKICFIICTNNDMYLQECLFYIDQLNIPEGFEIDVISVQDAKSMTSAYNEGMEASDAKYKVYLHQDVFIIYKDFLNSLIEIFNTDERIGMIGMVGAPKMPANGIMWYAQREGALYNKSYSLESKMSYQYSIADGYHTVEVIDGLLMATSCDIKWRDDLFDAWHYYDISQSYEFLRKGLKIVVPEQKVPWCYHDGRLMNLIKYGHYRRIGMEEYKEYFQLQRFVVSRDTVMGNAENIRVIIIAHNQYNQVIDTLENIRENTDYSEQEILIVDNGSEDRLRYWLKDQKAHPYITCNGIIEGYGKVLAEVISQYKLNKEILFLKPGARISAETINLLRHVFEREASVASVTSILDENSEKQIKDFLYKQVLYIRHNASLISSQLLMDLNREILENLKLPESVERYIAYVAVSKGYHSYAYNRSLFVKECLNDEKDIYVEMFDDIVDKEYMKEMLDISNLCIYPDLSIIDILKEETGEGLNILEVGCNCGANLLELKNRFPKAKLYGIERNDVLAKMAKQNANIQIIGSEYNKEFIIDFEDTKFDYIILGDIIQTLQNVEDVIIKCNNCLKENGELISSIPNSMHYLKLGKIINGKFGYKIIRDVEHRIVNLFSYDNIMELFEKCGSKIEEISYTGSESMLSNRDKKLVNELLKMSEETEGFMYYALRYIIISSKKTAVSEKND